MKRSMLAAVAVCAMCATAQAQQPISMMFSPERAYGSMDYVQTVTYVRNNTGQIIDLIAGRYEVTRTVPAERRVSTDTPGCVSAPPLGNVARAVTVGVSSSTGSVCEPSTLPSMPDWRRERTAPRFRVSTANQPPEASITDRAGPPRDIQQRRKSEGSGPATEKVALA